MVTAAQLRAGMAIRFEGQPYKVVSCDYHPGQGKMGGVAHTRLKNLATGTFWEHSFRAELKLEDLPVQKQSLEFLYSDGDNCIFMDPGTYEQVGLPESILGPAKRFLQPGAELPVEFFQGEPISVVFPAVAEARVVRTAPASHAQQDSAWKEASLSNGLTTRVPLFIAPGEVVRVEVNTGRYVERARSDHKCIA